jgi:protein subunit release factor B
VNPTVTDAKQRELQALFVRLGIREQDLLEKFVRASGPGGQKVNKTSSAVYLKHLPTGTEVKVQVHRSQSINRFQARRLLAARLLAKVEGVATAEAARIEKVRRQKRKRSKRAKARMLDDKKVAGEKKASRRRPDGSD